MRDYSGLLLCLFLSYLSPQCSKMQSMDSGNIVYAIETVIQQDAPAPNGEFSEKLYRQILQYNTSAERSVFFNGKASATFETDIDYGFKSPKILLRKEGEDDYGRGGLFRVI